MRLSTLLAASSLLFLLGSSGCGINLDHQLAVDAGLDQATLSRIDAIVAAINDGVGLDDETRALVEEINATLAEGVEVGFTEETLARVDRLLSALEQGLEIGLKPDTLATIDGLVAALDQAPDQWEQAIRQILAALRADGSALAAAMASEIEGVLDQASQSAQQIVASAGAEIRCNVDFLGQRIGSTTNELVGRSVIGKLRYILSGRFMTLPAQNPWLCNVVPGEITLEDKGERSFAKDPLIDVSGFNFSSAALDVWIRLPNGQKWQGASLSNASAPGTEYKVQVNLQDIDLRSVPAGSWLVLDWRPRDEGPKVVSPPSEGKGCGGKTTHKAQKQAAAAGDEDMPQTLVPIMLPETSRARFKIGVAMADVRARPDPADRVIWQASQGASYEVTGRLASASWYRITTEAGAGWVRTGDGACTDCEDVEVVDFAPAVPVAKFTSSKHANDASGAAIPARLDANAASQLKHDLLQGRVRVEVSPRAPIPTPSVSPTPPLELTPRAATRRANPRVSPGVATGAPSGLPTAIPLESLLGAKIAEIAGAPSCTHQRVGADPAPGPDVTIAGLGPLYVQFDDLSTGVIERWDWTFGDGARATDPEPMHVYTQPGVYTPMLTVENSSGKSSPYVATAAKIQVLRPQPVADFDPSATAGAAPLEVHFSNTSTDAVSWVWSFGDGASSSEKSPTHSFARPGDYTVSLTATDGARSDKVTCSALIQVGQSNLKVSLDEPAVLPGQAPHTVKFVPRTEGGTGARWRWSFGDGTEHEASSGAAQTHRYRFPGPYHVTLEVEDAGGNRASAAIDLTAPPPTPACRYTDAFSEEDGEVTCGLGAAAAGMSCRGSYCDDVSLYCCQYTYPGEADPRAMPEETPYTISEESGGGSRNSSFGGLLGGAWCTGSNCDNLGFVWLRPEGMMVLPPFPVFPAFSEEGAGYGRCPNGMFVAGVTCSGSYCDDLLLFCSPVVYLGRAN